MVATNNFSEDPHWKNSSSVDHSFKLEKRLSFDLVHQTGAQRNEIWSKGLRMNYCRRLYGKQFLSLTKERVKVDAIEVKEKISPHKANEAGQILQIFWGPNFSIP